MKERKGLELIALPRRKTFGGWHQNTLVFLDGKEIGHIQTVKRPLRPASTHMARKADGRGGLGGDVRWLLLQEGLRTEEVDEIMESGSRKSKEDRRDG